MSSLIVNIMSIKVGTSKGLILFKSIFCLLMNSLRVLINNIILLFQRQSPVIIPILIISGHIKHSKFTAKQVIDSTKRMMWETQLDLNLVSLHTFYRT